MTISEDLRVFFQPGLVGRASTAWHHLQSIAELKVHKHIVVFFLPFVILHYFLLERFYMICESIIQSNLLFFFYIFLSRKTSGERDFHRDRKFMESCAGKLHTSHLCRNKCCCLTLRSSVRLQAACSAGQVDSIFCFCSRLIDYSSFLMPPLGRRPCTRRDEFDRQPHFRAVCTGLSVMWCAKRHEVCLKSVYAGYRTLFYFLVLNDGKKTTTTQ